ncbi:zinc finger protein 184 [Ixodes scapularis]|uniref:zinc finger protein 184 n=1 Tax=Ixodes scapularis TaxID=6945 RepID=UPI001A9E6374|nr:zinc finger protein 184 [Ixodes scapularis]
MKPKSRAFGILKQTTQASRSTIWPWSQRKYSEWHISALEKGSCLPDESTVWVPSETSWWDKRVEFEDIESQTTTLEGEAEGWHPKTPPRQENRHQCRLCPYYSRSVDRVINHERAHTERKPFSCHICQKTFSSKHLLGPHIRIHTGEKPFRCGVCPKAFTQKSSLVRHTRVHTGEKPYRCNICGGSFADVSYFLRHKRTHYRR